MFEIAHREGPTPPRRKTPVPHATRHACPFCGLAPVRGGSQCRVCGTWRPRERDLPRAHWRQRSPRAPQEFDDPAELADTADHHEGFLDPEFDTEVEIFSFIAPKQRSDWQGLLWQDCPGYLSGEDE